VRIHGLHIIRGYALAYTQYALAYAPNNVTTTADRSAFTGIYFPRVSNERRLSYLQSPVTEAETGRMITQHPRR
jgi:hypothetical protein